MVLAGDWRTTYLAQLQFLLDRLKGFLFSIKKGKLPIVGLLDSLMLSDTSCLALSAEYAYVSIMDHNSLGAIFIVEYIFVRNRLNRANLLTGQTANAFFIIKLRLPPEIRVRLMRHFRKFRRIRSLYQCLNRFCQFSLPMTPPALQLPIPAPGAEAPQQENRSRREA